jgi:hypothetical protein
VGKLGLPKFARNKGPPSNSAHQSARDSVSTGAFQGSRALLTLDQGWVLRRAGSCGYQAAEVRD